MQELRGVDMYRESESLSSLAVHIVKDSQKLIQQEKDLLRAEISEEWVKVKYSFYLLFITTVMLVTVSVLTSLALVQLLAAITSLPLWSCYIIVAVIFGGVGIGYLKYFKKHFNELNFLPSETFASIKENLKCLVTKPS
jgi:hypothetical protein